jgi:hypothetical protein
MTTGGGTGTTGTIIQVPGASAVHVNAAVSVPVLNDDWWWDWDNDTGTYLTHQPSM